MIPDTYDNRHWLLSFLAEMKREAKRLREIVESKVPRREKPWPRRGGLRTVNGDKRFMWRP